MNRDRLRSLFSSYDPEIQFIIEQVLQLEQEHITMDRPRLKDQIDEIITEEAKQLLGISQRPRTARG